MFRDANSEQRRETKKKKLDRGFGVSNDSKAASKAAAATSRDFEHFHFSTFCLVRFRKRSLLPAHSTCHFPLPSAVTSKNLSLALN